MKIETKVSISLNEIKELIAEKYKINGNFDLYLEDELVNSKEDSNVSRQEAEQPWYPDDSGEWVELPETIERFPKELDYSRVEFLRKYERASFNYCNVVEWGHSVDIGEGDGRIVAYKVVRK